MFDSCKGEKICKVSNSPPLQVLRLFQGYWAVTAKRLLLLLIGEGGGGNRWKLDFERHGFFCCQQWSLATMEHSVCSQNYVLKTRMFSTPVPTCHFCISHSSSVQFGEVVPRHLRYIWWQYIWSRFNLWTKPRNCRKSKSVTGHSTMFYIHLNDRMLKIERKKSVPTKKMNKKKSTLFATRKTSPPHSSSVCCK